MIVAKPDAPPKLLLLEQSCGITAESQPFDMAGEITHRVLVNYRVAPQVLSQFELGPLEWDTYKNTAFLSICLLRYKSLAPTWWPRLLAHRDSSEILYRLAVSLPDEERPLRGFLSLLLLCSSRLLTEAGSRVAPHKFTYSPVELRVHDTMLTVQAPGVDFATDLEDAQLRPPESSIFESLHDAETFLLDLAGNLSIGPQNMARLQTISHSPWKSRFLTARRLQFALLDPWIEAGLLEFDSIMYMEDLRQVWGRTRLLESYKR